MHSQFFFRSLLVICHVHGRCEPPRTIRWRLQRVEQSETHVTEQEDASREKKRLSPARKPLDASGPGLFLGWSVLLWLRSKSRALPRAPVAVSRFWPPRRRLRRACGRGGPRCAGRRYAVHKLHGWLRRKWDKARIAAVLE